MKNVSLIDFEFGRKHCLIFSLASCFAVHLRRGLIKFEPNSMEPDTDGLGTVSLARRPCTVSSGKSSETTRLVCFLVENLVLGGRRRAS